MKRLLFTCLLLSIFTQSAFAALSTSDIAFVAFNADGDDDFAIVLLVDVTNETIYFTDNESDGNGGLLDNNEGVLEWNSGLTTIDAGTIIVFTDTDNQTNPNFGASHGTLSMPDGSMNLAGEGDAILAFQGSGPTNPSTFLAGIQNESNNSGDLTNTGLVEGTNFVTFTSGAHDDGGEYTGVRSGEVMFDGYLALINGDPANNWTTEASNGENILPISTEMFSIDAPAPVSLTSFYAKSMDAKTVKLSWSTGGESEENNEYFSIEYSDDGREFIEVDKVLGAGTTFETKHYQFMHREAKAGANYYRLRQVDYDGTFSFSDTKVVVIKNQHEISVQPTLVQDEITVRINGSLNNDGAIEIINWLGQVVMVSEISGDADNFTINVNDLENGHYIVRISSGNVLNSTRFVKL